MEEREKQNIYTSAAIETQIKLYEKELAELRTTKLHAVQQYKSAPKELVKEKRVEVKKALKDISRLEEEINAYYVEIKKYISTSNNSETKQASENEIYGYFIDLKRLLKLAKQSKKVRDLDGIRFFHGASAFIPLLGFIIFGFIPLLASGVVSLTDLNTPRIQDMEFCGFKNYVTILKNADERSYASYLSTLVFMLNVPICIGLSLYLANLVNKTKFGQRIIRSALFIPYVCSTMVIGLTFKMLYRERGGVLNTVLDSMGFEGIGWLTDNPWAFMMSAIIMSVWSGMGFCIVLYQAALARVDKTYYEAAAVDGASPFYSFWKITLPAVSPTTGYLVTMKLIWGLQSMVETHILAGDGETVPVWFNSQAWVSDTVVKHIYNMVWVFPSSYGYGLASAAGWILAIIVLIITQINLRIQKKVVCYDF